MQDSLGMSTPEGLIKTSILDYLALKRIFVWPNDSVGIFDPSKKVYRKNNSRHHLKGVADILGIYNGKPLAIEVKSRVGRATTKQKHFIELFKLHGGIAFIARSVDDVIEGLAL